MNRYYIKNIGLRGVGMCGVFLTSLLYASEGVNDIQAAKYQLIKQLQKEYCIEHRLPSATGLEKQVDVKQWLAGRHHSEKQALSEFYSRIQPQALQYLRDYQLAVILDREYKRKLQELRDNPYVVLESAHDESVVCLACSYLETVGAVWKAKQRGTPNAKLQKIVRNAIQEVVKEWRDLNPYARTLSKGEREYMENRLLHICERELSN